VLVTDRLSVSFGSAFYPIHPEFWGILLPKNIPYRTMKLLRVILFTLLLAAFLTPYEAEERFTSVRVLVIDRGQADGILIRTPNSKWVTIDAGKDGLQAQSMANPAIWGNVDSVAVAFVSHRHGDHYSGLPPILTNFPVGLLVMNMADCPNRSTDDTIRNVASSLGIPTQSVGADTLFVDGVRFIVAPPDNTLDACPSHENDNSIVVRMDHGDFSMLFTGDSETDERTWLMENHSDFLDVDILKASHHGSINGADGEANGESWIQHVDPEAVVISAKEGNSYGHPHDGAMNIYEPAVGIDRVYCTTRMGTIRIYGWPSGNFRVHKQTPFSGSCRF